MIENDLALLCKHCKERYRPAIPLSITMYVAIMEAFVHDHKDCSPTARPV